MERKRYPTDVSDAEWALVEPLVPAVKAGGRSAKWTRRELVNGSFYLLRSGEAWRLLPHDLPPWQTIYHDFRQWRTDGTWETINARLRERVRQRAGREATPSAGVVDSQSVKTVHKGGRAATTPASR